MSTPKKVAVLYHVLAHYREPVFQLLCQQNEGIEYTLFSDPNNTYVPVKYIDPHKADIPVQQGGLRWRFVENRWFLTHFLWQKGAVGQAVSKEFGTIIYLGSAYYVSTWISVLLARLTGKRVLMWTHGFLRNEKGAKGFIRKVFYRLADGLLLYHDRGKEILIQKGFHPEKLHVIYNSLDYETQVKIRTTISQEDKAACRRRLFKNPDLPILLFIGRLIPQKKLPMLIEAAKRLDDNGRTCNVLIVGDGVEKESLCQYIQQLGLADNVCVYGPSYDEACNALLISMSDLCISPGAVGLTCIHSMTYGTPVITHDDPDAQGPEYEAIRMGDNGTFFKKDNVEDLAAVIDRWLVEHPDRHRIETQCHAVVDRFYNPKFQVDIINSVV